MTRYEKMAVLISALALLVSLLSPIVSYFYFDASAKDYKYRATFVMGTSDGSGSECNWKKKGPDSCRVSIAFLVNNVGERPAESPQIAVQLQSHCQPISPSFLIRQSSTRSRKWASIISIRWWVRLRQIIPFKSHLVRRS